MFALLAAVFPGAAHAAERVALVIGVSGYRTIPSLTNPSRDAATVSAALREVGFEVTQLNQPAQLTRDAIGTALVRFRAQAEQADAAIIYYAGHGVEVGGSNWLLPADVTADAPEDLEVKAIPASSALNSVRGARTVRLVILDACRDNPFATNPGWASGQRAFASRGLGRETSKAGNVVLLLATQPGTRASDGSGGLNSPFAKALAAALVTEGMQIAELPTMVSRRMLATDRIEQRPDQQGIFDEPRWMFKAAVSPPRPAPVPAPLPAPDQGSRVPMIPATGQGRVGGVAGLMRECDRQAGWEFDPDRPADSPYVSWEALLPQLAIPACTRALDAAPNSPRMMRNLGWGYEKQGDMTKARPLYERAAAMGHAASMSIIGGMYELGKGYPQDYAQARSWYERAAANGSGAAMYNMGMLYFSGNGVAIDYVQSRRWLEQGAALGNSNAMSQMGWLYEKGLGLPADINQAKVWYERSARAGNSSGMLNLGVMYFNGVVVPRDYAQARRWIEQSATLGLGNALNWLGFLYANGYGVTKDLAQARTWYQQAAAKGNAQAKEWLAKNP